MAGPGACDDGASVTVLSVTVVQTVLVYLCIPAAIYGVIALLTMWPKFARSPRYRPGQPWTYEPVWWTGNPEGVGAHGAHAGGHAESETGTDEGPVKTARGGARGNW
jgi:hypothetical protein